MTNLTDEALKGKIREAVQHNTNQNGEKISLYSVKRKNKLLFVQSSSSMLRW